MDNIYLDSDHNLTLSGLQDSNNNYVNDAVVTATVKDYVGNEVAGSTWPVTLDYVSSSNGDYTGVLPATLQLTNSVTYYVEIVAIQNSLKKTWRHQLLAQYDLN